MPKVFVLSLHRSGTQSAGQFLHDAGLRVCGSLSSINGIDYEAQVPGLETKRARVVDLLRPAFRDDECRIRSANAPANFVTIKHAASNLLRNSPGKESLQLKRHIAAWDTDFLYDILSR